MRLANLLRTTRMLLGHLLCGMVVGWLGALVSLVTGYTVGEAVVVFISAAGLALMIGAAKQVGLSSSVARRFAGLG